MNVPDNKSFDQAVAEFLQATELLEVRDFLSGAQKLVARRDDARIYGLRILSGQILHRISLNENQKNLGALTDLLVKLIEIIRVRTDFSLVEKTGAHNYLAGAHSALVREVGCNDDNSDFGKARQAAIARVSTIVKGFEVSLQRNRPVNGTAVSAPPPAPAA